MKNLILEITSRCNISCFMCIRQAWEDSMGDMDVETFRSILPSFSRLESLNLSGYGEPFLHPQLVSMIQVARERLPGHARITLTSNGTLIDETLAREVLDAGLDGIALSMDSLEADQLPAIRGGIALDTLTECLKTLVNLKENLGKDSFQIGISFTAMKRNVRELPRLIRFAADHGVSTVWVNNILPHTEEAAKETLYDCYSQTVLDRLKPVKEQLVEMGITPSAFHALSAKLSFKKFRGGPLTLSPEEQLALQCVQALSSEELSMGGILSTLLRMLERNGAEFDEYQKIFEECLSIAASRNLELHLPRIIPRTERECNFIKNKTCFISWDGWVRPCSQLSHDYACFHYGRPKMVRSVSFGRVTEENLEDIWNSQSYRMFRENVERFPFSPCGDCGLADGCGYISPEGEFFSDCNMYEQPCGDCLWSRGILNCP
jgi:putative metalloenzyme radical SAM/SPASM domain maturase